eukprot:4894557-Pyramimonas_sp.AAC.1
MARPSEPSGSRPRGARSLVEPRPDLRPGGVQRGALPSRAKEARRDCLLRASPFPPRICARHR